MSRLPVTGSDEGTWGEILNDFLLVEHDAAGVLKDVVRSTDPRLTDTRAPSDSSVTDTKISGTLSPSKITGTAVITTDSRLSDTRVPSDSSVTDTKISGTLSQTKITNLTSDLSAKAADSAVVHNTGNETVAGTKTFTGSILIKGPGPFADVMAYGAIGDGTTDDTTAINNAITGAGSGGTVFAPAGKTFKITSTIAITSSINIDFSGSTIKKSTTMTSYIMTVSGSISATIKNITLDGNRSGGATGGGIQFSSGVTATMRDCSITSTKAQGLFATGSNTSVTCIRVNSSDNVGGSNNGDGFYAVSSAVLLTYDCIANSNDRQGFFFDSTAGDGCRLSGSTTRNLRAGATIKSNYGTSDYFRSVDDFSFGLSIEGNTTTWTGPTNWAFDFLEFKDTGKTGANSSGTGLQLYGISDCHFGTVIAKGMLGYGIAVAGYQPNPAKTLTADVTATATTISISSSSSLPSSGTYKLALGSYLNGDSEVVTVTGGQGTTTLTVTRGSDGTLPVAHVSGANALFNYPSTNNSFGTVTVDHAGASDNDPAINISGGASNNSFGIVRAISTTAAISIGEDTEPRSNNYNTIGTLHANGCAYSVVGFRGGMYNHIGRVITRDCYVSTVTGGAFQANGLIDFSTINTAHNTIGFLDHRDTSTTVATVPWRLVYADSSAYSNYVNDGYSRDTIKDATLDLNTGNFFTLRSSIRRTQLSSFDASESWTNSTDNTFTGMEGTGGKKIVGGAGSNVQSAHTFTPIDLSAMVDFEWFKITTYVENVSDKNAITIRIGSDASNYISYSLSTSLITSNGLQAYYLRKGGYTVTVGTPNWSSIARVDIFVKGTAGTFAVTFDDLVALKSSFSATVPSHASQHGSSGSDPITPSSIGAATTSHASTHATGGSDIITPYSLGADSFFEDRRGANVETMPRLFMDSSGTALVSANIYAVLTLVKATASYTAARFMTGSGTVSLTEFRVGVWNQAGTSLLGQTADISASVAASTFMLSANAGFQSSIALTAGQYVWVGLVAVGATPPTLIGRTYGNSTTTVTIGTQFTRQPTGYAGGGFSNTLASTAGRFCPWIILV